jgi:hypothetical protein
MNEAGYVTVYVRHLSGAAPLAVMKMSLARKLTVVCAHLPKPQNRLYL